MTLKNALKTMVISFCAATTFQVAAVSLATLVAGDNYAHMMPPVELYVFLLVGVLCALPVLVLVRSEAAPRWEWRVRRVLHLLLTGGLTFGALAYFGWVTPENLWWPIGIFLFLYAALSVIDAVHAKRLADRINKKIASHDDENATH